MVDRAMWLHIRIPVQHVCLCTATLQVQAMKQTDPWLKESYQLPNIACFSNNYEPK